MTRKEEFLQRIKNIEKSDFKKVIDKQLTLEEMAKIYNMDVKTLKQKIQNLASSDIEWNKLFKMLIDTAKLLLLQYWLLTLLVSYLPFFKNFPV